MQYRSLPCSLIVSLVAGTCLSAAGPVHAAVDAGELLNLSLEELSNLEVTSVSKRAEKASEASAAVFVITHEDIKRAGALSIPEALRLAPGVNVARAGANQWAVAVRGFNDQFSNKLLVLIDGRTVYTPLFAGVYWDMQDVMLEDIDRIEVIRGPGATLWGANAVNGVINIITKKAGDTQGNVAIAAAGTITRDQVSLRHGGTIEGVDYRVYATRKDVNNLQNTAGADARDNNHKTQVGFRADSADGADKFTFQGDAFHGGNQLMLVLPTTAASPYTTSQRDNESIMGGNMLGRWTRTLESGNELSLQVYYDGLHRDNSVYSWIQHTVDLDGQYAFKLASHDILVGGGYRSMWDDFDGSFYISFNPAQKNYSLINFFAQDKFALVPEQLYLTLGSKFEHNEFSGYEIQPNARLSWHIDENQFAWASVARAVRSPSRSVDGLSLKSSVLVLAGPTLVYAQLNGTPNSRAEDLNAYEIGYRFKPQKNVSVDTTAFFNDYSDTANLSTGSPSVQTGFGFPARIVLPLTLTNTGKAKSWGGEMAMNWDVNDKLQFSGSYSLLHMQVQGSTLTNNAGKSPSQQVNLRSHYNFGEGWEWDNALYWVDELEPTAGSPIQAYARFDTQISWKAMENVELNLVGQNLFDPAHQEFSGFIYQNAVQVPRSVFGSVTVRF